MLASLLFRMLSRMFKNRKNLKAPARFLQYNVFLSLYLIYTGSGKKECQECKNSDKKSEIKGFQVMKVWPEGYSKPFLKEQPKLEQYNEN